MAVGQFYLRLNLNVPTTVHPPELNNKNRKYMKKKKFEFEMEKKYSGDINLMHLMNRMYMGFSF